MLGLRDAAVEQQAKLLEVVSRPRRLLDKLAVNPREFSSSRVTFRARAHVRCCSQSSPCGLGLCGIRMGLCESKPAAASRICLILDSYIHISSRTCQSRGNQRPIRCTNGAAARGLMSCPRRLCGGRSLLHFLALRAAIAHARRVAPICVVRSGSVCVRCFHLGLVRDKCILGAQSC